MVRTTFSIGKTNSFSFFTFFSGACAITDSSLHFGIIFDAFWHTFSIFFWLSFGMAFWMPLFRFLFQNGSQNGPTKKHCGSFWEPLGGKDDPKASPKRTIPRELFWIECPMVSRMAPRSPQDRQGVAFCIDFGSFGVNFGIEFGIIVEPFGII